MNAWSYALLGLPGMITGAVIGGGNYLLGVPDAGEVGAAVGANVRDAIDQGDDLIEQGSDVLLAPVRTVTDVAAGLGDNAEKIAEEARKAAEEARNALDRVLGFGETAIMVGGALVVGTTVLAGGALLAGTVFYLTGRAEPLVQFMSRSVR